MAQVERLWEFLQGLSPPTRNNLLTELERLELCGVEMPGSADIQAKLRTEFRKDGAGQNRLANPQRYFFAPLEGLVVDGAPQHANAGRIPRGSLAPIWEWITRDLLPTMARDFNAQMKDLIAADKRREAKQAAAAFQTKVFKSLENTLASPDGAAQTRARLATYTAARSAYDDLVKIKGVLGAHDALAKFDDALPERISKFDNAVVDGIIKLLDDLAKGNAEAVPFAITLIERRLKRPWQLMRLATKAAASKDAADVAATRYAIAVTMVIDRLEDHGAALRIALKHNRVAIARALLAEIYDIEYALQVRIDRFAESAWGIRLRALMEAIDAMVAAEVSRFPEEVGHVLNSRSLRSHDSLAGRLTYLAWKGRDVLTNGATHIKKLMA
jgi:hypothetical protein